MQEPPPAPASAALSADVQVLADVGVLAVAVALFDDVQATAVATCLVDGAWSVYGLVHVDHLIGDLPFGSMHRGLPFGSVHEDHPFELEHEGPPSRMVWCPGPLVVAACCQVLHC